MNIMNYELRIIELFLGGSVVSDASTAGKGGLMNPAASNS
jgi:hypothetical protein